MNVRAKMVGWTFMLVVVLALATRAHFQWLGLAIPGALLVGDGFVAGARRDTIAVHPPGRGDLN